MLGHPKLGSRAKATSTRADRLREKGRSMSSGSTWRAIKSRSMAARTLIRTRSLLNAPSELLQCTFNGYQPARRFHAGCSLRKPYYVTTPIFYVNAEPHIGHLHSLVLADVLKRYRHLRHGEHEPRPVFLTGTDEHGMKIQKAANNQGVTPLELCDRVSTRFEALARAANCDYDVFYRTTNEKHVHMVQDVWRSLREKGLIYKARYEGWYSVSDEAYYTASQVRDEESANGPIKVSVETGQAVEWTQEENYMFKLSQYRQPLLQWLTSNESAIQPSTRYNEVKSYLEAGELGDLSISRPRSRLQWGIEVPEDPSHTIYVWMDALLNYLSYTGYPKDHERLWPADTHVIGKDIIRFHAVYWPAILMSLDLPLPKQIVAHAHWTMGNFKMSKSRGNVVNPFEALQDFSIDGVRFFLMSKGGLSSDSDFAPEHVARDYRKFLAGQMGNVLSRFQSKAMLRKMSQALDSGKSGAVDQPHDPKSPLLKIICELPTLYDEKMSDCNISGAIDIALDALAEVNAYIAQVEPWKIDDPKTFHAVASESLEVLRKAALLVSPIIPGSAATLLEGLGRPASTAWSEVEADLTSSGPQALVARTLTHGPSKPVFPPLQAAREVRR